MNDHLIEIVFKNIPLTEISRLIQNLTSNGHVITSYNLTCYGEKKVHWEDMSSIEKIFKDHNDFGLFINLIEFKKGKLSLPNCGLAIYKQNNKVDLEINFQLSEIKKQDLTSLVPDLIQFSKSIAKQSNIDEYFCGLEPAEDLETRLFTEDIIGPFSID